MNRVLRYLLVPRDYVRPLGELHWSIEDNALERPGGVSFAFAAEIGLFLDGFGSVRPPVHFGHVIHLLHLIGFGPPEAPNPVAGLADAVRRTGRRLRHAGALCGHLCEPVPTEPSSPDLAELVDRLARPEPIGIEAFGSVADYRDGLAAEPPLEPDEFAAIVAGRFRAMSIAAVDDWLRTGGSPREGTGDRLAQMVDAGRPRALEDALDEVAGHPRLRGSTELVRRLEGALAFPTRRRSPDSLPIGGYSDVGNRGRPEALLPWQFAIDDDEFLRRFAENELLYFRREEPRIDQTEQVVIVVDQGVRTWGPVRRVLDAAVLALGRSAHRAGRSIAILASASPGPPIDPVADGASTLAAAIDGADLEPVPSTAVARALAAPGGSRRDLVLLTHPRCLRDRGLLDAIGRAGPDDRCFALAVEADGAAEWSRLAVAGPVVLSRFRAAPPPSPAPRPSPRSAGPADGPPGSAWPTGWSGDVEPLGYPFQFGLPAWAAPPRFEFTLDGQHLVVVGREGVVQLVGPGPRELQTLPRAWSAGALLRDVEAILAVPGGVVLGGAIDGRLVAAHYDLEQRRVKVFELGRAVGRSWEWLGFADLHVVIVRRRELMWAIDLTRRQAHLLGSDRIYGSSRLTRAVHRASERLMPDSDWYVVQDGQARPPLIGPWLRLDRSTGDLSFNDGPTIRPTSDGRPSLLHARIELARSRGPLLGLVVAAPGSPSRRIDLLRLPEGRVIEQLNGVGRPGPFAISPRGDRIACYGSGRLTIRAVGGGWIHQIPVNPPGWGYADFEGGPGWVAIRGTEWSSIVRWDGPALEIAKLDETIAPGEVRAMQPAPWPRSPAASPLAQPYDDQRFHPVRLGDSLQAWTDFFGQVILLTAGGLPLVHLWNVKGRVAAWMPGYWLGPSELTGQGATRDADRQIAAALKAAVATESTSTFARGRR